MPNNNNNSVAILAQDSFINVAPASFWAGLGGVRCACLEQALSFIAKVLAFVCLIRNGVQGCSRVEIRCARARFFWIMGVLPRCSPQPFLVAAFVLLSASFASAAPLVVPWPCPSWARPVSCSCAAFAFVRFRARRVDGRLLCCSGFGGVPCG